MMERRDFLLGSIGWGLVALSGVCAEAIAAESARVMMRKAIG
jgi:hypothetical protein